MINDGIRIDESSIINRRRRRGSGSGIGRLKYDLQQQQQFDGFSNFMDSYYLKNPPSRSLSSKRQKDYQ